MVYMPALTMNKSQIDALGDALADAKVAIESVTNRDLNIYSLDWRAQRSPVIDRTSPDFEHWYATEYGFTLGISQSLMFSLADLSSGISYGTNITGKSTSMIEHYISYIILSRIAAVLAMHATHFDLRYVKFGLKGSNGHIRVVSVSIPSHLKVSAYANNEIEFLLTARSIEFYTEISNWSITQKVAKISENLNGMCPEALSILLFQETPGIAAAMVSFIEAKKREELFEHLHEAFAEHIQKAVIDIGKYIFPEIIITALVIHTTAPKNP
jgi:hypothetical protein